MPGPALNGCRRFAATPGVGGDMGPGGMNPGRRIRRGKGPGLLVLSKRDSVGPRVLSVIGCLLLAGTLTVVPWIPGARTPEGMPWRLSGWDGWESWRHDRAMGVPGEESFKADVGAWRRRRDIEPGSVAAMRGYVDSMLQSGGTNRVEWIATMGVARTLVKHGGTNGVDVGRLLRVSLRTRDEPEGWKLAGQWAGQMSGPDRTLYAATAADHGEWEEAGRVLSAGAWTNGLGRALVEVHGWASGSAGWVRDDAMALVQRLGVAGGEEGVLGLRAMLACAVTRRDAVTGEAAMEGLKKAGAARLLDFLREDSLRGEGGGGTGAAARWPRPVEWREVLPWTR